MVSPAAGDMPNGVSTPPAALHTNGSPTTTGRREALDHMPNASQANTTHTANTNGTSQSQSHNQSHRSAGPAATSSNKPPPAPDPASAKKPRDARLIHMILANLGVRTYEDRVPLQLMDF